MTTRPLTDAEVARWAEDSRPSIQVLARDLQRARELVRKLLMRMEEAERKLGEVTAERDKEKAAAVDEWKRAEAATRKYNNLRPEVDILRKKNRDFRERFEAAEHDRDGWREQVAVVTEEKYQAVAERDEARRQLTTEREVSAHWKARMDDAVVAAEEERAKRREVEAKLVDSHWGQCWGNRPDPRDGEYLKATACPICRRVLGGET